MTKAIIFDFDGVLVESIDIKTEAFRGMFKNEGSDIVAKVVDYHCRNMGVSRFDKFRYIYKEILNRPLTEAVFQDLCQQFARLVLDAVLNAPYVKGAQEFLANYAHIYSCFIASATPQDEIEEIIIRRGMSHYFKAVYGAPKKKNDIVKEILSNYGLSAESIVYIGDAISDYDAANANGVHFIARINGNELIFKNMDCHKVRDLSALNKIIETL
jgi:HAD superfamily hydrolase (TIGR01549 family)